MIKSDMHDASLQRDGQAEEKITFKCSNEEETQRPQNLKPEMGPVIGILIRGNFVKVNLVACFEAWMRQVM